MCTSHIDLMTHTQAFPQDESTQTMKGSPCCVGFKWPCLHPCSTTCRVTYFSMKVEGWYPSVIQKGVQKCKNLNNDFVNYGIERPGNTKDLETPISFCWNLLPKEKNYNFLLISNLIKSDNFRILIWGRRAYCDITGG